MCAYTHIHTQKHAHTHAYTHTHKSTHTYTYTHAHTHAYTLTQTHTNTHIHTHAHTCTQTHTHIHTRMHTNTHIQHTHKLTLVSNLVEFLMWSGEGSEYGCTYTHIIYVRNAERRVIYTFIPLNLLVDQSSYSSLLFYYNKYICAYSTYIYMYTIQKRICVPNFNDY